MQGSAAGARGRATGGERGCQSKRRGGKLRPALSLRRDAGSVGNELPAPCHPLRSWPDAQPLPHSAAEAEGPRHVPGDRSGFLGPCCCQLCDALRPSQRGRGAAGQAAAKRLEEAEEEDGEQSVRATAARGQGARRRKSNRRREGELRVRLHAFLSARFSRRTTQQTRGLVLAQE